MTSRICLLHALLQFLSRVRSDGVVQFELVSFYDMDRRILSSTGTPECCSPSPNDTVTGWCENSCTNSIVSCRLHYLSESEPDCDSRSGDAGQSLPRVPPAFTTQHDASAVMHRHYFRPGTTIDVPFPGAWTNKSFEVEFNVYQYPNSRKLATFRWDESNALALAERDSSRVLIDMKSFRQDRWLAVRARVKCDDYFWLANCSVYCKPSFGANGYYTCDSEGNKICRDGYVDPSSDCVKLVPHCDSDPCQRNGTCRNVYEGFICDCEHGYGGLFCESDTNYCLSHPCQNKGTCKSSFGSYSCVCSPGYTGVSCESEPDFCLSDPCLNGGLCETKLVNGFSLVSGYTCKCSAPYLGDHCEKVNDFCSPNECLHGGTCQSLMKPISGYYFTCECSTSYRGQRCEEEIDFCLSNPCQSRETCRRNENGYECECLDGNCGEQTNACLSNPCKNGGTCNPTDDGYTCKCLGGYHGPRCYACTVKGSLLGAALATVAVLLLTR